MEGGTLMYRKLLATLLILTCIIAINAPPPSFAETWPSELKTITIAEMLGALDGYLQTESIGGAMAGALKTGIYTATVNGITGEIIPQMDIPMNTLGHLNRDYIYNRITFNQRRLSKTSWVVIDRAILTSLWEQGFYSKEIDAYVKTLDPSFESTLIRIKEATQNNPTFPVSQNFYPNLEKTIALLEGETDDPEALIDIAIKFLVDASVKESGDELSLKNGGGSFTKIEITYNPQKSLSGNNDIILAQIMASFTKKGYDYYKSQSSAIKDNDTDVPEITVTDIPSSIRGLEITLNKREATVGIDPVELDVAPFAENSRTMVPFKFVGESLGATIAWHPEDSSVSYVLGDQTVILYLGKNIALVNDNAVPIDENPLIIPRAVNQRTMVPIKFISETLGFSVTWDPITQSIGVHNNPYYKNNAMGGELVE